MGRTIMGAVVSLDGRIAHDVDDVGPMFDWYGNGNGNGDVEWAFSAHQEYPCRTTRRPGTSCRPFTRGSVRW